MTYISDVIGQDYLDWKNQYILISSRTGSGKTTFILNQLLPHAIKQNKYILYLCNRRILKDQFNENSNWAFKEIFPDVKCENMSEFDSHIIIRSYQYFETLRDVSYGIKIHGNNNDIYISYENILYFVYDEAHYFLTDSLFNRNCSYWFCRFLGYPRNFFPEYLKPQGTHIFLTATPEPLKVFLLAHYPAYREFKFISTINYPKSFLFNQTSCDIRSQFIERNKLIRDANEPVRRINITAQGSTIELVPVDKKTKEQLLADAKKIHLGQFFIESILSLIPEIKKLNHPYKEYSLDEESPYKNMETTYWTDYASLFSEICRKSNSNNCPLEKWMIFLNNEKDGRDLEQKLIGKKIDAILLSASTFSKDKKCKQEYKNIVQNGKFRSTVLIATSVMDCGVSIKDPSVKNIVISESKKTTFLQMLGRKRLQNGEKIHLYIRCFNRKYITSLKQRYEKQLIFLVNYHYNQQKSIIPLSSNPDGTINYWNKYNAYFTERFEDFDKSHISAYSSLLYIYYSGSSSNKNIDEEMNEVILSRQPGNSSFIYIIYLLYLYEKALDADPKDKEFYLKEQLSWIGQTYSEKNWLNQDKICDRLIAMLKKYKKKNIIKITNNNITMGYNVVSTDKFSHDCMNILKECQIHTKTLHKYLLKFEKGELPQNVALSNIFEELGIMYKVKSTQSTYCGQRVSMWKIIKL